MHGRTLKCICDRGYSGEFCDQFVDKCRPNPCKNKGKCHNLIDDFYCECPPEYGQTKDCSTRLVNPCHSSPCFHNGTCFPIASGRVSLNGVNINTYSGFTCKCTSHYRGDICELPADPCSLNPCNHRGQCVLSKDQESYTCRCYPAFTGKNCETYFDPCEKKNMCKNGGVCLPTPEGYKCQCPAEFSGENCEVMLNVCSTMKCLNGGKCVVLNNLPKCQCASSRFVGTRCEIDLNLVTPKDSAFSSALAASDLSCDLLGSDVSPIDYIFFALILFALVIVIIATVYVYVYFGIKRTKKYHSQVQYDNDILILLDKN
ncbi:delta C isoform X2 [Brachionus plicatilis]|uniref:Delta C isoform X2 n=1 Tax=Brachionus plicatilis TaxID=10195 RepID=A0A3M7P2S9_BRAPC|nr:delta C isoform X2 [Brachionus plicatilis]